MKIFNVFFLIFNDFILICKFLLQIFLILIIFNKNAYFEKKEIVFFSMLDFICPSQLILYIFWLNV